MFLDALDAQSRALKEQIMSRANTVDAENWRGAVYYVSNDGDDANDGQTPSSAWRTLTRVNSMTFAVGSAVLFERGGLWRGCLIARAGVTYSAYGEGAKPRIYGSPENGSGAHKWRLLEGTDNIWVYYKEMNEIGSIVFDEGTDNERFGYKLYYSVDTATKEYYYYYKPYGKLVFPEALRQDLYFFIAPHKAYLENGCPDILDFANTGRLYLRCDAGNPGEVFSSIEFCALAKQEVGASTYGHIVSVPCNWDGAPITVDNLSLKFGAVHGVGGGDNRGLTVTNCEIGWIGGAVFRWIPSGDGFYKTEALGNAVEVTRNCVDFTVADNWIYQCYDTGITNQSSYRPEREVRNLRYARNLVEYTSMCMEIWLGGDNAMPEGFGMRDVTVEENILRFIGYGISTQRPNFVVGGAVFQSAWGLGKPNNPAYDYILKNNVFYLTADECQMLYLVAGKAEWLPKLDGNTYVDVCGRRMGRYHAKTPQEYQMAYADHFSDYTFDDAGADVLREIYGDTHAQVAMLADEALLVNRYKHLCRDVWHQGVPTDNRF